MGRLLHVPALFSFWSTMGSTASWDVLRKKKQKKKTNKKQTWSKPCECDLGWLILSRRAPQVSHGNMGHATHKSAGTKGVQNQQGSRILTCTAA